MSSIRCYGGVELMAKTERVNIRVSSEIKDWYCKLSDKTGISMSSLMAMALSEYIDQKKSIQAMGTLGQMYNEMQNFEPEDKMNHLKKQFEFE